MAKHIQVHHLVECGTLKSYSDLPGFVERLFCEAKDLQVICKPCHKNITHDPQTRSARGRKRVNWIEQYVIEITFTINNDGDPMFKIVYMDKSEEHLMITDGPSLRAAIDRAMLSVHAQQS